MKNLLFVASLVFITPLPLAAQEDSGVTVFENDQWFVYRNRIGCTLSASYVSGSQLMVGFNNVTNNVDFSIVSERFRSVEANQEFRIRVAFINVRGDQTYSDYNYAQFRGLVLPSGQRMIYGRFVADQFLSDFSRFQFIGV